MKIFCMCLLFVDVCCLFVWCMCCVCIILILFFCDVVSLIGVKFKKFKLVFDGIFELISRGETR